MPRHTPRIRRTTVVLALVLASFPLALPGVSADPNTPTILFGMNPGTRGNETQQEVVLDLEAQAGRTLPGVRVFDLWDQAFPSSDDLWLRDTGHTLFFSVRAKRTNGAVVLWRDIAAAAPGSPLYQEIVGWATKIKGFGAPMYFAFNHEPEATASDANGTAAEFIAAWRKVIGVFREQNVTNATYVFITTGYAYRVTDERRADLWYPGDAYVDAIGEDDYNWSDCRPGVSTPWRSLQYIADPLRVWAEDHPGKELMITEWASHEDPAVAGRKASWITEAQALFKQPGWERFTVMLYYHRTLKPTCNFWLDSSASSMSAWLAMANDPYYMRGVQVIDTHAPTAPGMPSGASTVPGTIDLTWAAATDDLASNLLYRVFRDGASNPVGTVSSASTGTVTFRDTGLTPGASHTYRVSASDGVNVGPLSPVSLPITVLSTAEPLFADGFDGGFANWTSVNGLALDATQGMPAAPSARAAVVNGRASASKTLSTTASMLCMSERVNLGSIGTSTVSLLRLRTAADGAVARVFVNNARRIAMRSDVTGAQLVSTATLPLGAWRSVELCADVAAGGRLSLYVEGALVGGPWTQSLGATPFGRVLLGDSDAKTVTVNYDDVVVDMAAG